MDIQPTPKRRWGKFKLSGLFIAGIIFVLTFFFLFKVSQYYVQIKNNGAGPSSPASSGASNLTGQSLNIRPIGASDHVLGNRNAPISIVEFSDLDCPFCKSFHPTLKQLISEYRGEVNWIYRHFPIDSIHPDARQKAEAAECAAELGGEGTFWEYIDIIFADTEDNLLGIAGRTGLNKKDFNDCLEHNKYDRRVSQDIAEAILAGGTGTPYSIILAGEYKIPVEGAVSLAQLKAIIDALLNNYE